MDNTEDVIRNTLTNREKRCFRKQNKIPEEKKSI
jgi:hypothetical protein